MLLHLLLSAAFAVSPDAPESMLNRPDAELRARLNAELGRVAGLWPDIEKTLDTIGRAIEDGKGLFITDQPRLRLAKSAAGRIALHVANAPVGGGEFPL